MYREFFARSPLLSLPLLSLVIFIGVFALLVARAMRRKPAAFSPLASLPLDLERADLELDAPANDPAEVRS